MALLRCHGDSDCNKTQIIRNFNIWLGRYPPKKIQSSHLNSFEFNCFFLNSVNETIRTIHVRGTTEEKKEETSLPFSITDTDITCKRNDAIQWRIQGRGPGSPLTFGPNWGLKGWKKKFKTPPPLISGSGWPGSPFIWRSGSAAADIHVNEIMLGDGEAWTRDRSLDIVLSAIAYELT